MEEDKLYWGTKDCKKDDMAQRHTKEWSKQSKDTNWSNQTNDPTNHMNKRYYDMGKGVF